MRIRRMLMLATLAVLGLSGTQAQAQVRVGVVVGPTYYRPYRYRYYAPPPVVIVPRPVYVAPPPPVVYVQPAPVYAPPPPPPVVSAAPPAPSPAAPPPPPLGSVAPY